MGKMVKKNFSGERVAVGGLSGDVLAHLVSCVHCGNLTDVDCIAPMARTIR